MSDPERIDSETGATVELALSELRERLPSNLEQLRDQLPGVEPERRITDWGRSERLEGLVDRTIYDFLYHYWFRVEVEGVDNVPGEGGALLVANHAGATPSDGAMIAKAVREEHPRPRAVHVGTNQKLAGVPGLGMLATKLGAVGGHPANARRLLIDEEQLVLAFPEGRKGARKPLKERYRLRRFGVDGFAEAAVGAGLPIVPVALLGAEEAAPQLGPPGPLRRLRPLAQLPPIPAPPLPAKFKIRFLEPAHPGRNGSPEPTDLYEEIRALIQENLLEMVGERRSVWLG